MKKEEKNSFSLKHVLQKKNFKIPNITPKHMQTLLF